MSAIRLSIFDIFKIGPGPSSSHTIGPMKAAFSFRKNLTLLPLNKLKRATALRISLYGSLSATGKGHGTDRAIVAGLLGWQPETCDSRKMSQLLKRKAAKYKMNIKGINLTITNRTIRHENVSYKKTPYENTMVMRLLGGKKVILAKEYYSVGGGFVKCKGKREKKIPLPPYCYGNMEELRKTIQKSNADINKIILRNEEVITGKSREEIYRDLEKVIHVMEEAVERGLRTKGVLPGAIGLARKAHTLLKGGQKTFCKTRHISDRFLVLLNAYAMAVAEENAAGNRVVTAPTSGSAGVIPAVIYMLRHHLKVKKRVIVQGLVAAAAVGFITKHNASISGAEVGCQGEIGVASAMAAALLAHVNKQSLDIISNAAEIALEHHLGLTCDPLGGYVQIPCIERNAVGAVSAYNAYLLAAAGDPRKQRVKLDQVIAAMLETGRHMSTRYRETARGGLAVCVPVC